MCCQGCAAVADIIESSGWDQYYQFRSAPGSKPEADAEDWSTYDREAVLNSLTRTLEGSLRQTTLSIEGIRCAACIWLLDQGMQGLPGIRDFVVDINTGRAQVSWAADVLPLSTILARIEQLGYLPAVSGTSAAARNQATEARVAMQRLVVAGIAAMQVMMYSVGLYAGFFQGMDPVTREFLRWFACLIAVPAVLYSAYPFYSSAWRSVTQLKPNMDVPVTLALTVALTASIYAMTADLPDVYFDSAAMFVFFLSIARFFEIRVRHRARSRLDTLSRLVPDQALRKTPTGYERVGRVELEPGNLIRVSVGDRIAADGTVLEGSGAVDESLLSGEAHPVRRAAGDRVLAGSLLQSGTLLIRVEALDHNTLIADIIQMSSQAQVSPAGPESLADRIAGGLVLAILAAAGTTALVWYWLDPAQVLPATLAVLVITCPCAVALATPTARSAAASALSRFGIMLTRPDALERLEKVTHLIWDKTGTLTQGNVRIVETASRGPALTEQDALRIAWALEQHSQHPLACAFEDAIPADETSLLAKHVEIIPGQGLRGTVNGETWYLGRATFAGKMGTIPKNKHPGATTVALGDGVEVRCWFYLTDPVKEDAVSVLRQLSRLGYSSEIGSGDARNAVMSLAGKLGITRWRANLLPRDKAEAVHVARRAGDKVAVIGDGINDAPALAAADVAIAMDDGTALAKRQADIVIMGRRLTPLIEAVSMARNIRATIRQNLTWALAYNFIAVPIAAMGLIAPWLAALGMSLSSIAVVLNSSRLSGEKAERTTLAVHSGAQAAESA